MLIFRPLQSLNGHLNAPAALVKLFQDSTQVHSLHTSHNCIQPFGEFDGLALVKEVGMLPRDLRSLMNINKKMADLDVE